VRVVFDVNVLIRLTFGSPVVARLIRAANDGALKVLAADILIDERAETARKPRLAHRIDFVVYAELLAFLKEEAEFIPLRQPFPSCRDRDDEYLLGLARDGQARFLVTNDQDLLCLGKLGECEIVTPEDLEARIRKPGPA
jgi:putative PIN family toxin of toxin-antitoxin system